MLGSKIINQNVYLKTKRIQFCKYNKVNVDALTKFGFITTKNDAHLADSEFYCQTK